MSFKQLIEEIRQYAAQNKIEHVAVALSGGADSIATAMTLLKAGVHIEALHCNFHLRGEESLRDCQFVKVFCEENNIPLIIKDFDVERHINSHKSTSVEMACRELRFSWFKEILLEGRVQRVALGHNADDNIETFFINLFRGSGTRGLKGINKDNGKYWRPLLNITRKEILNFLEENHQDFVIDSSNLTNDYRRNYLRNTIIPQLKAEWKGFEKSMLSSISYLSEENKIVERAVQDLLKNSSALKVEDILSFPSPILLIRRFIEPAHPFTTTAQEIYDAIMASKPHIRVWNVRKGIIKLRNRILSVEMSHCE